MFLNALRLRSAEVSFLWEKTRYGLYEKPSNFVAELCCHQKIESGLALLVVLSKMAKPLMSGRFLNHRSIIARVCGQGKGLPSSCGSRLRTSCRA